MQNILSDIEKTSISLFNWLLSFVCILFVRFFLEALSSPTSSGVIASDAGTLLQYGIFYLVITVGFALIIDLFINKKELSAKILLFCLPILWFAPIFDFLVSKTHGYRMSYLFDSGKTLLIDLLTFFGPNITHGVTIGIRVELAIVFLGIASIVYYYSKSKIKALASVVVSYIFIFISGSLAGIFNLTGKIQYLSSKSPIISNSLHATLIPYSDTRAFEIVFNSLISQILFILLFVLTLIWALRTQSKITHAVIKNARPERVLFYCAPVFIGIWYSYKGQLGHFSSTLEIFGFLSMLLSYICIWIFSVCINDIEDEKIDHISNVSRPLITGQVNSADMKNAALITFFMALLGSFSAGFYPFYMILVFAAVSLIYSKTPLRLRNYPGISTFLIALACLSGFMSGVFYLSAFKALTNVPGNVSLSILVFFTLFVNFKDLKDIEGDEASGVKTLPVIFGKKYGFAVTGAVIALGYLSLPFFLHQYSLLIASIPAAILSYIVVNKKPLKDKNFLYIYFVFILAGVILLYPMQ